MILTLDRKYKLPTYTIGKLYIDEEYFCDTLEDKDRGLTDSMSVSEISKLKVKGETAIPTGKYKVTVNIVSPKFGSKPFYKKVCNGKLPRLLNVKGFDGILIHVGDGYNGKNLTEGCILIGKNTIKGGLTEGKNTFELLYKKLIEVSSTDTVHINIE